MLAFVLMSGCNKLTWTEHEARGPCEITPFSHSDYMMYDYTYVVVALVVWLYLCKRHMNAASDVFLHSVRCTKLESPLKKTH